MICPALVMTLVRVAARWVKEGKKSDHLVNVHIRPGQSCTLYDLPEVLVSV